MIELNDCYLTQAFYPASHKGQLVFVIKSPVEENFKQIRDIGNTRGPFNLTIEWPTDNSIKVKPKPCPFCGSTDIHTYQPTAYEIGNDASVNCESCGAEVRGNNINSAISIWNRRVNE